MKNLMHCNVSKICLVVCLFVFLLILTIFSHILLQGEGVAYRGRLLVELESKLGEEIDKELEVMKGPELIRVQVIPDH